MGVSGKRWAVHDREGNPIYLTEERWDHITDPSNHPEVGDFEDLVMVALRRGRRRQEPLNPRKYRYALLSASLPPGFTHVVVIVVFGVDVDTLGRSTPNNYVATVFFQAHRIQELIMMPKYTLSSSADTAIHYDYDQDVDILYVSFVSGVPATTAVELNENILLRFNLERRQAVGLTLMDFSVLAQPTPLGPRHFPLSGLQDLELDRQEIVLDLLAAAPVNHILTIAAYAASASEMLPIVSIENPFAVVA